ncbi:MAG: NADH-quinone oxidoreductase subunit NuoE [Actinomycetota bacterium]
MSGGGKADTSLMGVPLIRPAVAPLSDRFRSDADEVIARYPKGQERSALLPLLYLVQGEHGFVSSQGISAISEMLGLTRAEVAGVASFYTMFKRSPQGRWLISVCTQPACAFAGGTELIRRLEETLGVERGGTSPDGTISIEEVECLCACDGAPVFSVNYENYERMAVEDAVSMVESLRSGGEPPAGARGEIPADFKTVSRRMSGVEAPR